MNEQNNLIEYADPILYDLENKDFDPSGSFMLKMAKALGGSVLEVGCGTGRVTIPLAQNGVNIVGLDVVPGMIERAKAKSNGLFIEWIAADARSFQLNRKFRLIFETGCVFQHILVRLEQEAYLANVRTHLEDNGRFVISLIFPHPDILTNVDTEKDWFKVQHPDGLEIRVSGTEHYDEVNQIKTETAYRRWTDADGKEVLRIAPLPLRYVFPQEMEAMLHYNGFTILERYGDYDSSPLTNESRMQIYVCRKR